MKFDLFKKEVQNFFSTYQRKTLSSDEFHPAGVLVPFLNLDGEAHLLLTLRTDKVANHKNQVAFPGGAREPQDEDIIRTALREAYEETGIRPKDVSLWGIFDDHYTISYFTITPVMGEIPYPYRFIPQEEEIREIFTVPVQWFLSADNFEEKLWEKNGVTYPVYYYYYEKYEIWGITAFIINSFIDKVFGFNPAQTRLENDERWKEMVKRARIDSNNKP